MNMRSFLVALLPLALFGGVASAQSEVRWRAEKMSELGQFWVPECVLPVPGTGTLFVSNVVAEKDQYWTDDGKGYISVLAGDKMKMLRWLRSEPQAVLNGPKGMCLLDGKLYFADNTRLMRCDAKDGSGLEVVAQGFIKANDLACDGDAVWVSHSAAGKIWRVDVNGSAREIAAPIGVNGLTFFHDKQLQITRMFAVSWDLHDVYEVFPVGERTPRAFGLAEHFTNLDGIEVLADGTFIVSDFMGNKVSAITPDEKTVYTLAELGSPADIGIDRSSMILYVPQFFQDKVVLFRLSQAGLR